jgi:hypothetical protein
MAMFIKIISGGQTGVDRAALDVALELGLPCGGWCPRGRLAEDGRIPDRYPLAEHPSDAFPPRTRANIEDADGTAVLLARSADRQGGGTALTLRLAAASGKPYFVGYVNDPRDALALRNWLADNRVTVLNVAGPRETKSPGIRAAAVAFLRTLLGG